MTDAEIAQCVGCSRTGLYRLELFKQAKQILKTGKLERKRGKVFRDRGGGRHVDGIEEDHPNKRDK
jgi:hypothetical protein